MIIKPVIVIQNKLPDIDWRARALKAEESLLELRVKFDTLYRIIDRCVEFADNIRVKSVDAKIRSHANGLVNEIGAVYEERHRPVKREYGMNAYR